MAMVVNEIKLNAAMTATADAIRAKTGDSAQIPFDYENGTGFADAVEAIPQGGEGDPYAISDAINDGTIKYYKHDVSVNIRERPFYALTDLTFFSNRRLIGFGNYNLFSTNALRYANAGFINSFNPNYVIQARRLKTLVLMKKSVCPLLGINANSGIGDHITQVYVPDKDELGELLPEQYKLATNWSQYASQIHGFSEAPTYDSSITYYIGDVCKYNGRFYGYCKEDLTSSTGNAPSGTADDNTYWEYVGDLG